MNQCNKLFIQNTLSQFNNGKRIFYHKQKPLSDLPINSVSSFKLITIYSWYEPCKWQPTPILLPGESHGHRSRQATVQRGAKSWTWLKQLSTSHARRHVITVRWLIQRVRGVDGAYCPKALQSVSAMAGSSLPLGPKIVNIHAVLHMVLGYFTQELAEVLEKAVVGIWQLFY